MSLIRFYAVRKNMPRLNRVYYSYIFRLADEKYGELFVKNFRIYLTSFRVRSLRKIVGAAISFHDRIKNEIIDHVDGRNVSARCAFVKKPSFRFAKPA